MTTPVAEDCRRCGLVIEDGKKYLCPPCQFYCFVFDLESDADHRAEFRKFNPDFPFYEGVK